MTRLGRHPVLTCFVALLLALGTVWAVKLVRLGRSVSTNAEYWSQPRGQAGGLLYVAFGDSAAQGIGASTPGRGYVSLVAQRLRDSTGQPIEVVNLSSSGARIRDVLDRQLPALEALGREPDVVTVAIGGNDIGAYDRATFASEAGRLTAALQAAATLRASAEKHGLNVVRLQDALKEQGWQAMATEFAADWFHPNDRGHRVWADAFWTRIGPDIRTLSTSHVARHTTAASARSPTGPRSLPGRAEWPCQRG